MEEKATASSMEMIFAIAKQSPSAGSPYKQPTLHCHLWQKSQVLWSCNTRLRNTFFWLKNLNLRVRSPPE